MGLIGITYFPCPLLLFAARHFKQESFTMAEIHQIIKSQFSLLDELFMGKVSIKNKNFQREFYPQKCRKKRNMCF